MRQPKKPPSWAEIFRGFTPDLMRRASKPEIGAAIDRANDGAWNYEECGYRAPQGLTRNEFWLLVKLSRSSGRESVPLNDITGQPFTYRLPAAADRILHLAAQEMAGSVASATSRLDSPESQARYILRSLTEEAIASSQIEGAAVTRDDAKRMLRENRPPRTAGERMVSNNYATIRMVNNRRDELMTPEFLCEIQKSLTAETLDVPDQSGRFRRADEAIGVWDEEDNELLHAPPPAAELPRRIELLCEFANTRDDPSVPGKFTHPVIRAIVLHFWVGFDHPFADGNGRTARALFYWSMLRSGYWLAEYLTISEIIRSHPKKYGTAYLDTETDGNDLTYFILYHLEVLERSLKAFRAYMERKTAERARLVATVSLARFNSRQRDVLAHALRDAAGTWTYESHGREHRVTIPTARTDLLGLEELGLLNGNRVGRRFEFVPAPDIAERLRRLAAPPGRLGKRKA